MIDIANAVERFQLSTGAFLAVLDGVSERAWLLRPVGETWCLAETVEHVMLTNRAIHATLQHLLSATFPAAAPRFDDGAISAAMFGMGPAPALAEPKGRFATPTEGIAALIDVRDELVAWARSTTGDLRAYGLPHPVFGVFDGVQWVLFAAAHTDNHIPQLRALRAHSDFAPQSRGA